MWRAVQWGKVPSFCRMCSYIWNDIGRSTGCRCAVAGWRPAKTPPGHCSAGTKRRKPPPAAGRASLGPLRGSTSVRDKIQNYDIFKKCFQAIMTSSDLFSTHYELPHHNNIRNKAKVAHEFAFSPNKQPLRKNRPSFVTGGRNRRGLKKWHMCISCSKAATSCQSVFENGQVARSLLSPCCWTYRNTIGTYPEN